ncbi:MAG: Gfo/Idh/MocA family oxidoreductase [Phycisphaerales bacterium]|jgi:predicted dehydrogenase|nr:Gfo/Idh/MocA family oxidoreductase [Phycisphaerales bacterium]MBT7170984.1 Gfo/Idh/MocA family oxidoreductase [Phycisphaerales bacterium]
MTVSRRSLLKATAGAAALPTILTAPLFGADAPSNRINMALIGCGGMGRGNARNLMQKPSVQFVAACDVDSNHAKQSAGTFNKKYNTKGTKTYSDYRKLVLNKNIDAVIIATPDHWHASIGIACAQAGMDIYGEKPLTRYLKEGRELVNAVEDAGCVWQTGSWQRSKNQFHRACELVRNGRIGKLTHVEVGLPTGKTNKISAAVQPVPKDLDYNAWVGPARKLPYRSQQVHFNWRWVLAYGGGQLLDWIGHHGDIAHWGMDCDNTGPVSVKPIVATYPTGGLWNAPIHYKCECTYKNGVKMTVADVANTSRGMGTKFIGENGQWIHCGRKGIWASDPKVLRSVIQPNEIKLYNTGGDHHGNFVDCIRTRKKTITPIETAHRSASIGHLCMIALETGQTISFNPDTEQILNNPKAAAMLQRAYRAPYTL